jgi:hypothetical protein
MIHELQLQDLDNVDINRGTNNETVLSVNYVQLT